MKKFKTIAAALGGAVLFFALGRYVSIPSPIDTVNICVQYGLLGALAVVFGPLAGTLAGLLGHILIDLTAGEMCWSWILATAAFGALVGGLSGITRVEPDALGGENIVKFNLIQVAAHVVCWAGVAPVLEILLYNESMDRIFEQGLTAALSNAVTAAIVGTALLVAYSALKGRRKGTNN